MSWIRSCAIHLISGFYSYIHNNCVAHHTISTIHAIYKSVASHSISATRTFRHPILSTDEYIQGCRLGIDSMADTGCAGKHACVIEFLEGKTVTAYGYGSHLPSTPDLPIANVKMIMMMVQPAFYVVTSRFTWEIKWKIAYCVPTSVDYMVC